MGPARRAVVVGVVALVGSLIGDPARGRTRELIVVDESIPPGDAAFAGQVTAFVARIAMVVGWDGKGGGLAGRGFTRQEDAATYAKAGHPAFGLLSPHAFVQFFASGDIEVIGQAGGLPGHDALPQVVARKDSRVGTDIYRTPGFRLATPPAMELRWINVLFDGLLRPGEHFRLVPVASTLEAVTAVVDGRADVTFADQAFRKTLDRKLAAELKVVHTSPPLPPAAIVAFKKYARPDDRKRLVDALAKICIGPGLNVCGNLNVFSMRAGANEFHPHLAYKYVNYKL